MKQIGFNSQAHMNNLGTKRLSIASRESDTLPKIPGIEDIQIPPIVPSNIPKGVTDIFAEEIKKAVFGLTFNKKMLEDSSASF